MTGNDSSEQGASGAEPLLVSPPFIWPEARVLAGRADYAERPPGRELFLRAGLISGLLVGVDDQGIKWLDELLGTPGPGRICLVLVLFPAGPTRAAHLQAIHMLGASCAEGGKQLDIRLLPLEEYYERDFKRMNLPPTVIQAHDQTTGRTVMTIGSVGDAGHDRFGVGSLNFVFEPDDALRDAWRRWFQDCLDAAAPLTNETLPIPHLVPARGDSRAGQLWQDYLSACGASRPEPQPAPPVPSQTGETPPTPGSGTAEPWDGGITALDPLAQLLQKAYGAGCLVTVDESTRAKPLSIPVKAALMGEEAGRRVGQLKQKQTFTLTVLDEEDARQLEKCRVVADLLDLLTYPLGKGVRWLPERAKALFEKELEARKKKGLESLEKTMGGNVGKFVQGRRGKIQNDVNRMSQRLGRGDSVPLPKLEEILADVECRLAAALKNGLTPRLAYNRIAAPDLTRTAPDQNWAQPLQLLLRSARLFRERVVGKTSKRHCSPETFNEVDVWNAMNVFNDAFVKKPGVRQAHIELADLEEIEANQEAQRAKCAAVHQIITGTTQP